ncbi:DoxX family protein [Mucilaginibacter terrenus]|uniref:DoxX family protein n=1 Tax=Mucilaginibacter terrenus TaxID=2482727 RepID=A0A3E2NW79_9SPHI|nr:DoxX family protein [Mucilaginibacter terrenus]RFZ85252.1 DoxX family protein [Mucilaginibacter terrenus]
MELIKSLLYSDAGSQLNNWALCGFRVLLSVELFAVHGMKKFRLSNGWREVVPNPFHLPERLNSFVATFSDTVVPAFVILGIATRLVILPTIGVTAVGYFVVHRKDAPEVRDVPYIYTLCFLVLLFMGPGSVSIDRQLSSLL